MPNTGEWGSAEPLLQRAIVILREVLGSEHPDLLPPESNLSISFMVQEKYAEAEPMALSVLDRTVREYGEEHLYVAYELLNVGGLYDSWDKPEQALTYLERARALFERIGASEHPANAMLLRGLADVYLGLGRAAEGVPHVLRAEEIHVAGQSAGEFERVLDLETYEAILRDLGRAVEADSVRDVRLALEEAADSVGR